MKKENILNVFLMIVIGVIAVVGTVSAATTISTNIVTEGKIGIGTSTPFAKLSVVGNVYFRAPESVNAFTINDPANGENVLRYDNYESVKLLLMQNGAGNVGIGTSTPAHRLVVEGDNVPMSVGTQGLGAVDFLLGDEQPGGYDQGSPMGSIAFNTGGSMYLKYSADFWGELIPVKDGKFGIGTSSPASILHVSSGASATTTVDFGAQAITAKTCFNVRNTAGAATSFYIVGTTIVVEANRCR